MLEFLGDGYRRCQVDARQPLPTGRASSLKSISCCLKSILVREIHSVTNYKAPVKHLQTNKFCVLLLSKLVPICRIRCRAINTFHESSRWRHRDSVRQQQSTQTRVSAGDADSAQSPDSKRCTSQPWPVNSDLLDRSVRKNKTLNMIT